MKRIFKYKLSVGLQQLDMPKDWKCLHVAEQFTEASHLRGDLCLWALVDSTKTHYSCLINVLPTGAEIKSYQEGVHLGTIITREGEAWHVFLWPL